ncbi:MAG: voltage-gated chloride channel protein, partial [Ilumatobacteraceae bacterium]
MHEPARTVARAIGVLALCVIAGAVAGVGSWALFEALDEATAWRLEHDWLVWTLPAAALSLGAAYHWFGGEANRGTSLVIARNQPPVAGSVDDPVPARLAPMIFGAPWVAQLPGAS